jgi:hypothetical protein
MSEKKLKIIFLKNLALNPKTWHFETQKLKNIKNSRMRMSWKRHLDDQQFVDIIFIQHSHLNTTIV